MPTGHDSERLRNAGGAGIGSITFWIAMLVLAMFFGYLGWGYLFGN